MNKKRMVFITGITVVLAMFFLSCKTETASYPVITNVKLSKTAETVVLKISAEPETAPDTTTVGGKTESREMSLTGSYLDSKNFDLNWDAETVTLKMTAEPDNLGIQTVIWSIDPKGAVILTDNNDGSCTLKAEKEGTVTVTATTAGGVTAAECRVTVAGKYYTITNTAFVRAVKNRCRWKVEKDGTVKLSPGNMRAILAVEELYIFDEELTDLSGIEWFTNLRDLCCANTQVESLDVTPLVGFAVDGTIEVLNNGDSYEFVVDVTTPEGVSVKGRYPMGEVTFVDNSPILPSGDWLSVLREDKTVIFTPEDDTECTYRVYTSYFENAVEYEIMIYNYTTSETIQLDLLAPEGSTSIAGTYTTPADPDAPVAGEFIPGYKEFSVIRGTWPYLLYDPDNMYYVGAPGMEGTIEITETENGEFEIQLEMKDDAEPANTVTAHWSGPVRQL